MNHPTTRPTTRPTARLAALAVGAAATLVAAGPAVALEPGTLSLTGPTAVTVGSPAVMTASGHVPSDAYLERYVYVYAIPTSVVSACPAARTNALQLSQASSGQGGDTVAFVNVTGDFSVPIAYTAEQAGTFLLCGYLSEMVYDDATAQHVVTASAPATTTPPPQGLEPPSNSVRPSLAQPGRRMVCRRGTWSGADSYAYRWRVAGRRVRGATGRKLKVTTTIRGKLVTCAVTARNAAGTRTVLSRARKAR